MMTVESRHAITIATLGDWPKTRSSLFQPTRIKTKTKRTDLVFPAPWNKLQLIARNCDWFIALFVLVGIGQSSYLGIVFFDSHFKTTLLHIREHKQPRRRRPRYIFIFIFKLSLLKLP